VPGLLPEKDPNLEYGDILPLAVNRQTDEVSLAWPGLIRDLVRGVEAPKRVLHGEVDPETGAIDTTMAVMGGGLVGGRYVPKGALTANAIGRQADALPMDEASRMARPAPKMGQKFDDWIDDIYAPQNRGPGNKNPEGVVYRAVSPAEASAAEEAGSFDALGAGVFVEPSPDRYVGGGAYGGKKQGRIYEFDVSGMDADPSMRGGAGTGDFGYKSIPIDRVRRIWEWSPEENAHVLVRDDVGLAQSALANKASDKLAMKAAPIPATPQSGREFYEDNYERWLSLPNTM